MPGQSNWTPILTGDLESRAIDAVRRIASEIADSSRHLEHDASISGGSAGFAILLSYLADTGWLPAAREAALSRLASAIDTIADGVQAPSLFSGFTGVAWTVQHLRPQFADYVDEDTNTAVDDTLMHMLSSQRWHGHYDLIGGLVGFGVYALERLPSSSGHRLLERVIEHLNDRAIRMDHGITWLTPPELLVEPHRTQTPEGHYNLGLAHGVPGVIALLALACQRGVAVRTARVLLDGAVDWLLAQSNDPTAASCFDTFVPHGEGKRSTTSRLAWCYGDLGVSAAIFLAARCVNQPTWEAQALEIARRAARRPVDRSGAVDACMCHGAAGNGHIFNRFYQATGEAAFRVAAEQWFAFALAFQKPEGGVGGFQAFYSPTPGKPIQWTDDPGILMGSSGIGLCLLAAVHDAEPSWDRFLLVALPRRLDREPSQTGYVEPHDA